MPGATVRDFAAEHGIEAEDAIKVGMQEKSEEFSKQGGKIYREV